MKDMIVDNNLDLTDIEIVSEELKYRAASVEVCNINDSPKNGNLVIPREVFGNPVTKNTKLTFGDCVELVSVVRAAHVYCPLPLSTANRAELLYLLRLRGRHNGQHPHIVPVY